MNFTFTETEIRSEIFELRNTDVFCFFSCVNAVTVPSELWLQAIAASLKLKKDVLILEHPRVIVPELNSSARWLVDDTFLWLAPRSLSPVLEAVHANSLTYKSLKIHLQTFK